MAAPLRLPTGWFRSGATPERYDMGIAAPGEPAEIRSRGEAADGDGKGFGTLMQSIAAKKFAGQRVALSAELRAEAVEGAATIWMRVDGGRRRSLAFDNMEQRSSDGALSGTADWTPRSIVLDVPADADSVHFGFYLRGTGRSWARHFQLAVVDSGVALTAPPLRDSPINLDFSEIDPESD